MKPTIVTLVNILFFYFSLAQEFKGYTLDEIQAIHVEFDIHQQSNKGGDFTRYINSHMSEFWPHQILSRSGPIRQLGYHLREDVEIFVTETKEGSIPLEEYIKSPLVDGMIILHKGKIVFEEYPNMKDYYKHHSYSVTKPYVSTLIGLLEMEGKIEVHKTVSEYLTELKGTDWGEVPIIDVLDMTSGMGIDDNLFAQIFFNENGWIGNDNSKGGPSDQLAPAKKTGPSGQIYEYFSLNTEVLGWIIERITNRTAIQLIEECIWQKMGAESDALMFLPNANDRMYMGGLSAILRDHARFGLLFTPSGRIAPYNFIPDAYIKKIQQGGRPEIIKKSGPINLFIYDDPITAEHLVDGEPPRHSTYQWDIVMSDGDFFKEGGGGQGLYISPSRDLVIAYFGTRNFDSDGNLLINNLHQISRQLAKSGLFDK
ncbi:6-aminohexanoate-dimer hydrolase [Arenibacter sp. NBRC 103722]|uniref:serine hydrolase domain-containing protein n=1 Tax=Arenibacter sp. NBRC 103722 TaxID=1113929 RepID=UPI000852EEC3|nr:serine hydrolase [Arenibacter sp. NBRC 103722]MDX1766475.1 serine hydrolase [Arenibacter troitsensis]GBF22139.1 6-aminohexanoate-dimer hydrolase [Arenibacter sp. NBRC 103722]